MENTMNIREFNEISQAIVSILSILGFAAALIRAVQKSRINTETIIKKTIAVLSLLSLALAFLFPFLSTALPYPARLYMPLVSLLLAAIYFLFRDKEDVSSRDIGTMLFLILVVLYTTVLNIEITFSGAGIK